MSTASASASRKRVRAADDVLERTVHPGAAQQAAALLPQFAIYYKHTAACKCTHCWRPSTLDIKTVTDNGKETYFKVGYDTPLGKLMELFCNRAGIARSQARFYFNDEVIGELETPAGLKMEHGDAIQVMVDKSEASEELLNLKTVSDDGSETYFKLKYTTPLQKLMHAFCNAKGSGCQTCDLCSTATSSVRRTSRVHEAWRMALLSMSKSSHEPR